MRKYNRLMMRIVFIEEGKVKFQKILGISYELIESNYDGSLENKYVDFWIRLILVKVRFGSLKDYVIIFC